MEDVPLLSNVVEGEAPPTEEEPMEEETGEGEGDFATMLEEAQHYVSKIEALATDCEAIAEMMPDASANAEAARAAAEAAAAAIPDVEAAQIAYDGALATSGSESAEATQALRDLEDAVRVVKDSYDEALSACDEAKGMMPQLETGAEPGEAGLMAWAEQTE